MKSALSYISVYGTYNRISALNINVHRHKGCMGIEPVLLSSEKGLKQSALTIRRHISNQNNKKYIDRRSNFVTTECLN